jgi:hypothetical protein
MDFCRTVFIRMTYGWDISSLIIWDSSEGTIELSRIFLG